MSGTTPVPVSSLRKGSHVMIQGHPCRITDMTTSKMMSCTSGRDARHAGITCDGCRRAIKTIRYVCLDCDDYDLCAACETDDKPDMHAAGTHVFAKIEDSRLVDVDTYRK